MIKISDIIVATPVLPARFVSADYDRFLFFDFSLRGEFSIFDEIQRVAERGSRILVFYAHSLELLGLSGNGESWSGKMAEIDGTLSKRDEPYGLIVTDLNASWVMAQHSPVELGVFAFKSTSPCSLMILNSLSGEDFLAVEDFRSAAIDEGSRLNEHFDGEFIESIINNY
ncbi:hypothetical protein [Burkholderia cepacia]|uniref:hypothetical protein n=1 Tax=Burkholderia cepacia TaxID=292 RepID=UPI0012D894D2|nr:hypothetical protein [Burkholderia cepacia]